MGPGFLHVSQVGRGGGGGEAWDNSKMTREDNLFLGHEFSERHVGGLFR